MSKFHVWSYYRLKGILKLAAGVSNDSCDKATIMQIAGCVYKESNWFFYNLNAFTFLALSTSVPNNPLVAQPSLSSNLDICVALYKDPDLPKAYPILFGYIFTIILSLGHRSSVWTKQLTREDCNILYTSQVHLASLDDESFLEFSWLTQFPSKSRSDFCSDSCAQDADTAWIGSFAYYRAVSSPLSSVGISKLVLLPNYRQLFANSTQSLFESCKCKCASKTLYRIGEGINDIFYAMYRIYEHLLE